MSASVNAVSEPRASVPRAESGHRTAWRVQARLRRGRRQAGGRVGFRADDVADELLVAHTAYLDSPPRRWGGE
jgi:hypothetical protein